MAHNQAVLNYLYMMEELAEKAQAEAGPEDYLPMVLNIRDLIHDVCEDIEDEITPEYHPNFSVVPLDEPKYWQSDQSNYFERLYEHKGRKFRVKIRRNFYVEQSWARIQGFDPARMEWSQIGSIPFNYWPVAAQRVHAHCAPSIQEQGALLNLANDLCEIARKLMFSPE